MEKNAAQNIDPAVDEAIDHRVRSFLAKLNAPGGKPLEELSPQDARQVLDGLQSSVETELPAAKVSSLVRLLMAWIDVATNYATEP